MAVWNRVDSIHWTSVVWEWDALLLVVWEWDSLVTSSFYAWGKLVFTILIKWLIQRANSLITPPPSPPSLPPSLPPGCATFPPLSYRLSASVEWSMQNEWRCTNGRRAHWSVHLVQLVHDISHEKSVCLLLSPQSDHFSASNALSTLSSTTHRATVDSATPELRTGKTTCSSCLFSD